MMYIGRTIPEWHQRITQQLDTMVRLALLRAKYTGEMNPFADWQINVDY